MLVRGNERRGNYGGVSRLYSYRRSPAVIAAGGAIGWNQLQNMARYGKRAYDAISGYSKGYSSKKRSRTGPSAPKQSRLGDKRAQIYKGKSRGVGRRGKRKTLSNKQLTSQVARLKKKCTKGLSRTKTTNTAFDAFVISQGQCQAYDTHVGYRDHYNTILSALYFYDVSTSPPTMVVRDMTAVVLNQTIHINVHIKKETTYKNNSNSAIKLVVHQLKAIGSHNLEWYNLIDLDMANQVVAITSPTASCKTNPYINIADSRWAQLRGAYSVKKYAEIMLNPGDTYQTVQTARSRIDMEDFEADTDKYQQTLNSSILVVKAYASIMHDQANPTTRVGTGDGQVDVQETVTKTASYDGGQPFTAQTYTWTQLGVAMTNKVTNNGANRNSAVYSP